jgi:serine/threonine protein kinase
MTPPVAEPPVAEPPVAEPPVAEPPVAEPPVAEPPVAEPPVLAAGAEVLPGYRVEALLARGGRVDTYDVTSVERGCRAVVKVVRPDRVDEEHVRAAVLTEGALLTTLAHPHLVRGYELVTAPRPAIVLETLPGATLAALVDDGRLGVADAALLGRQLASVLGYLHRRGWVHLDVKPDNVVVQAGRAVLIDLGLATRPGRLERSVGTEGYAAPEQDAGGTVSAATDVWGLAATLVECLTGRPPGREPELRRVPDRLRPLLTACLRPDPGDRPGLAAVGAELDAVLAEPRVRSWWRRRPRRRRPRRSRPEG